MSIIRDRDPNCAMPIFLRAVGGCPEGHAATFCSRIQTIPQEV